MSARNYWLRLFGANLIAMLAFPGTLSPWWLDVLRHLGVVLAVMLVTWPERSEAGQ